MAYVNDVIDFTKGSKSHIGKAVVVEKNTGRKWTHFKLRVIEGPNKDKTWVVKLAYGRELEMYGTIVAKDAKTTKKHHEREYQKAEGRIMAVREAEKQFAPGDIVKIDNINKRERAWDMKVLEIDWKKGRIYGVQANPGYYGVAGKRAWASLTHPDVKITLVQKNAFDPATDETVQQQKARAAEAGAKRTATRRRKEDLRNLFGF